MSFSTFVRASLPSLTQSTFSHNQGKVGLEVGPEVGVEAARRTGGVYFAFVFANPDLFELFQLSERRMSIDFLWSFFLCSGLYVLATLKKYLGSLDR